MRKINYNVWKGQESCAKELFTVFHSISESKDESSKSEQALNEAMKAGFVRVKTTNILFVCYILFVLWNGRYW